MTYNNSDLMVVMNNNTINTIIRLLFTDFVINITWDFILSIRSNDNFMAERSLDLTMNNISNLEEVAAKRTETMLTKLPVNKMVKMNVIKSIKFNLSYGLMMRMRFVLFFNSYSQQIILF